MSVPLLDIAKNMVPGLAAALVKLVVEDGAVLQQFGFEAEPRLSRQYTREGVLPAGQFRAINGAYANEGKTTYLDEVVTLKPFGTKIKIDPKIAKSDGKFGLNQAAQQIDAAFRGLAKDLKKNIFKGDAISGLGFAGLQQLTDTGPASQSIAYDGQANGSTLASATKVVENFDALIAAVGNPDCLFADALMLAKINALTTTGSNSVLASKFRYSVWASADGYKFRVGEYDGIPIFTVGTDSQNAKILSWDEVQGIGTNCSSVYAVRFGFQGPKILVDNLQPEVRIVESEDGTTYIPDWMVALLVEDSYSIARLKGIKAA